MALQIRTNYTDTPINGVTTLNFARGLVNYGADFARKEVSADEAVITNLTCPVDCPEKFRIAFSPVADVYKGTGIDPSLYTPTRRGISLLSQVTEVWTLYDDAISTFNASLPVSAHLVLKLPSNEKITVGMVQTLIGRLVSSLFETGSTTNSRLTALLRGSMLPSDL